jgi:chromosome condensin MukBEF ATPase and DNA-binding subunit MukB
MTDEEIRKIRLEMLREKARMDRKERERDNMMNAAPKPSLEKRVEWLEADASAQRTAILRLERQVKHIRIGGTIVAAVAGWLLGSALT